uniref:Glycosyltransferase n=1 Tax=Strongyloides venezuelensis TaxID=75913 RepID=A0A0K0EY03_STRVS
MPSYSFFHALPWIEFRDEIKLFPEISLKVLPYALRTGYGLYKIPSIKISEVNFYEKCVFSTGEIFKRYRRGNSFFADKKIKSK